MRAAAPRLLTPVVVLAALAGRAESQVCSSVWLETFRAQNPQPLSLYPLFATFDLKVFDDDGAGPRAPALFLCGRFANSPFPEGGFPQCSRWDGHRWQQVGPAVHGEGSSLLIFDDDGSGPHQPALFMIGSFSLGVGQPRVDVARWDGATWSAIGGGLPQPPDPCNTARGVQLIGYDQDGPGPGPPNLYAVQAIILNGGFPCPSAGLGGRVYRLDGTHWTPVRDIAYPMAAAVLDDRIDPLPSLLIVTTAYPVGARSIVLQLKDGLWSDLLDQPNSSFTSLAVSDDDGPGPIRPAAYVGGTLHNSPPAHRLLRYDGASLVDVPAPPQGMTHLFSRDPDGGGPALEQLLATSHRSGPPITDGMVWRRQGTAWSPLGDPDRPDFPFPGAVAALEFFDEDGAGPHPPLLFAAGSFWEGDSNLHLVGAGKWSGEEWVPPGDVIPKSVYSILSVPQGLGPSHAAPGLYAGGAFISAGGIPARRIARWDGSWWQAAGGGLNGDVLAMCLFNDSTGPALIVGGAFTIAGSGPASCIAKWNGADWIPLGAGMNNRVHALAVYDDGAGPSLYAGGRFTTAGGVPAVGIARWRNGAWASVGHADHHVDALAVFNDGAGPRLYAGGKFTSIGGVGAARIAVWNGATWAPLGAGVASPGAFPPYEPASVAALKVHDDGSGPALYVAGRFLNAGGLTANSIGRWRGNAWSTLGTGFQVKYYTGSTQYILVPGFVSALEEFDDDGPGPGSTALVAAPFGLARWSGGAWSDYGLLGGPVRALAGHTRTEADPGPARSSSGAHSPMCIREGPTTPGAISTSLNWVHASRSPATPTATAPQARQS